MPPPLPPELRGARPPQPVPYIHIYTIVCICTYIYLCMYVCMYMYISYIYIYIFTYDTYDTYIYIYMYIHIIPRINIISIHVHPISYLLCIHSYILSHAALRRPARGDARAPGQIRQLGRSFVPLVYRRNVGHCSLPTLLDLVVLNPSC